MPDSIDVELVKLLGRDARQSSEALAKQLGTSAATVRRRLNKLLQSGLLRIVGVVDPAQFGLPLVAYIVFDIAHNMMTSVMEELAKLPQIKWVSTSTGRFDIIVMARFPTTTGLSEFMTKELAQVEGVNNSETFICLDTTKGRDIPLT